MNDVSALPPVPGTGSCGEYLGSIPGECKVSFCIQKSTEHIAIDAIS